MGRRGRDRRTQSCQVAARAYLRTRAPVQAQLTGRRADRASGAGHRVHRLEQLRRAADCVCTRARCTLVQPGKHDTLEQIAVGLGISTTTRLTLREPHDRATHTPRAVVDAGAHRPPPDERFLPDATVAEADRVKARRHLPERPAVRP